MELPKSYPIYFERRKYLLVLFVIIVTASGFITYYSFKAYTVYHIYSAFVFAVSLSYLSWLYFNPFCTIEQDYFEINSGFFSHKKYVFRDIQKVDINSNKDKLILIFNDYDSAEISIRQINKKERDKFIELIKIHVYRDLIERSG